MATAASPIKANAPKILFVDDGVSYLHSASAAATALGFRVATAESTEEGLSIVNGQQVDAVVCDWYMSGADGINMLERVHKFNPDLPIALQTGHNLSRFEQQRLDKIGARFYPKGTNVAEVVGRLLEQAGIGLGGVKQLEAKIKELKALNQDLLADLKASLLSIT